MRAMDSETRQRGARFFRLRVALSPALVIAGAAILYCGYQGVVRLSVSGMIAGAAAILAGLCLRLTLAFCPFCGARVNLRSGLLLWNYTCPHCHTSVAHGGGELQTGPSTAPLPPPSGGRCVCSCWARRWGFWYWRRPFPWAPPLYCW